LDALFEFLFKYRPAAFARGTLAFEPLVPSGLLWVACGAIAVAAAATYFRTREGETGSLGRGVLAGLRIVAALTVGFALLRPVLVVSEQIAQRSVVAILVDDSKSMRIADVGGQPRSSVVNRLVGAPDSSLLKSLADRFQIRTYRVGGVGKIGSAATLSYDATRTRLVGAALRVEDELAGTPVAGVVVLSDGSDNSASVPGEPALADQLSALRARGVPVYTVGVGSPRFARDIEISRVEAPREVLKDATVLINVVVTQRGFGGERLPVVVEDSGRIVGQATAAMPEDGEAVQVRVRVPASETGARLLRIHVPVQSGELVRENNERRTVVQVRNQRERILHLEGEPRFEIKFLRRATDGDPQLQVVTLLRSAKDKYLRLGVDDSLELATGFPKTRDELFSYRGVILGSIEASFFSADQLRMLSDFVSERGGGLMLLGGRRAFGEGGYGGTVLADAIPVEFSARRSDSLPAIELLPRPTVVGALHPAVQIAATDSLSVARWDSMPPVTSVNAWLRAKPGATVLLEGAPPEQSGPRRPLLAYQRFGRGRVVALAAQDVWLWQMHASVAVTDSTHEVFWRQMLRWLVSEVPDRVEGVVSQESATGDAIPVRAIVNDSGFFRANNARVTGTVTAPNGTTSALALDWAVDRDGEYLSTFVPGEIGVHQVSLMAVVGGDTVRSKPTFVRVAEPTDEYFGAEMRAALLRQISSQTGGAYYSPESAADLARDLAYSPSGATIVKKNDLWDMPVVCLVALLALGAEWILRRRWGLS
jgi:uncharacterized membrane protein